MLLQWMSLSTNTSILLYLYFKKNSQVKEHAREGLWHTVHPLNDVLSIYSEQEHLSSHPQQWTYFLKNSLPVHSWNKCHFVIILIHISDSTKWIKNLFQTLNGPSVLLLLLTADSCYMFLKFFSYGLLRAISILNTNSVSHVYHISCVYV